MKDSITNSYYYRRIIIQHNDNVMLSIIIIFLHHIPYYNDIVIIVSSALSPSHPLPTTVTRSHAREEAAYCTLDKRGRCELESVSVI